MDDLLRREKSKDKETTKHIPSKLYGDKTTVMSTSNFDSSLLVTKYRSILRLWVNMAKIELSERQWKLILDLLSIEERQNITRFYRLKDRYIALGSTMLKKSVVSWLGNVEFSQVILLKSAKGKPYTDVFYNQNQSKNNEPLGDSEEKNTNKTKMINAREGKLKENFKEKGEVLHIEETASPFEEKIVPSASWNFNVSHHGSIITFASEESAQIGIDVVDMNEKPNGVGSVRDFIEQFRRSLTQEEYLFLISLCPRTLNPIIGKNKTLKADETDIKQGKITTQISHPWQTNEVVAYQAFYSTWAMKEAFVKAKGDGMSFGLHRINTVSILSLVFNQENGHVDFNLQNTGGKALIVDSNKLNNWVLRFDQITTRALTINGAENELLPNGFQSGEKQYLVCTVIGPSPMDNRNFSKPPIYCNSQRSHIREDKISSNTTEHDRNLNVRRNSAKKIDKGQEKGILRQTGRYIRSLSNEVLSQLLCTTSQKITDLENSGDEEDYQVSDDYIDTSQNYLGDYHHLDMNPNNPLSETNSKKDDGSMDPNSITRSNLNHDEMNQNEILNFALECKRSIFVELNFYDLLPLSKQTKLEAHLY